MFLASHYDLMPAKQKEKLLNEMGEKMKSNNKLTKLVVFSNATSDIESLSNVLFRLGQSNKKQKISIEDKVFYKHF